MATLPSAEALGERPSIRPSGGVPSYDATGALRQIGAAGEAISATGHQMEVAARIVADAGIEQDKVNALAAANALNRARLNLEMDPKEGFSQARGNAVTKSDFSTSYMGKFKDAAKGIREGLSNDYQKQLFDRQAEVVGLQYQSALMHHQAKETIAFNIETRNNTIDIAMADSAARPGDDMAFEANLGVVREVVTAHEKDHSGLSGPELAKSVDVKMRRLTSKMVVARVSALLNDPSGIPKAQQLLLDNYRDMDWQDRDHMTKALRSADDAQSSRADGDRALNFTIGKAAAPPELPRDLGSPGLKPYDAPTLQSRADMVRKPSPYDAEFRAAAQKYGVPFEELKIRAAIESGMNPNAASDQGAIGLMQFIPSTAEMYGIDPRDPKQAIDGAARLMAAELKKAGGDWSKVDRAYHGGNIGANGPRTEQYVENARALREQILGASPGDLTQDGLENVRGMLQRQSDAIAQLRRPGDLVYRDMVRANAERAWMARYLEVKGANDQAVSQIYGLLGTAGSPTQPSQLPDQLRQAFNQLPGTTQHAIRNAMSSAHLPETAEQRDYFYELQGKAFSTEPKDVEAFQALALNRVADKMHRGRFDQLLHLQQQLASRDAKSEAEDKNIKRILSANADNAKMVEASVSGTGEAAKDLRVKMVSNFHGRLVEMVQEYKETNGKWPEYDDARKIGAVLLAEGTQPGKFWGSVWPNTKTYAESMSDPQTRGKGFAFTLPPRTSADYEKIADAFARDEKRRHTTEEELQRYVNRYVARNQRLPWTR